MQAKMMGPFQPYESFKNLNLIIAQVYTIHRTRWLTGLFNLESYNNSEFTFNTCRLVIKSRLNFALKEKGMLGADRAYIVG